MHKTSELCLKAPFCLTSAYLLSIIQAERSVSGGSLHMKIGIVTRSYSGKTNAETAALMKKDGFVCTEICFVQSDSDTWKYNGRGDIDSVSPERAAEITEIYRSEGIEVTSLGVFTDNRNPDDAENDANIAYFKKYILLAEHCGIPYVATECGFDGKLRCLAAQSYESTFQRMLSNMKLLADFAAEHNVSIAIEPCVLDVIPSAKRMRDFILQSGKKNIKVLLDPANLIANSSEEDIFRYLAPNIAYFHGKDRKVNDTYGRLLGDGDIDWRLFAELYKKYTPDIPFILEYTNADNAGEIKKRTDDYFI